MDNKKNSWGGKRRSSGRKKTCLKKIPFNRRINENILNILKIRSSAGYATKTAII